MTIKTSANIKRILIIIACLIMSTQVCLASSKIIQQNGDNEEIITEYEITEKFLTPKQIEESTYGNYSPRIGFDSTTNKATIVWHSDFSIGNFNTTIGKTILEHNGNGAPENKEIAHIAKLDIEDWLGAWDEDDHFTGGKYTKINTGDDFDAGNGNFEHKWNRWPSITEDASQIVWGGTYIYEDCDGDEFLVAINNLMLNEDVISPYNITKDVLIGSENFYTFHDDDVEDYYIGSEDFRVRRFNHSEIVQDSQNKLHVVWEYKPEGPSEQHICYTSNKKGNFPAGDALNKITVGDSPDLGIDNKDDLYLILYKENNGKYDLHWHKLSSDGNAKSIKEETLAKGLALNYVLGAGQWPASKLAVANDGTCHILYPNNGNLQYLKVSSEGKIIDEKEVAKNTKNFDITYDKKLDIIHITYLETKGQQEGTLYYKHKKSSNNASWSKAVKIKDTDFSHSEPNIIVDKNGSCHIVWDDSNPVLETSIIYYSVADNTAPETEPKTLGLGDTGVFMDENSTNFVNGEFSFTWQKAVDLFTGIDKYEVVLLGPQPKIILSDKNLIIDDEGGCYLKYDPAGLKEGEYTWYVKAYDAAGNWVQSKPGLSFIIDTTKPTVEILKPENSSTLPAIFTLEFEAKDANGISDKFVDLTIHFPPNIGEDHEEKIKSFPLGRIVNDEITKKTETDNIYEVAIDLNKHMKIYNEEKGTDYELKGGFIVEATVTVTDNAKNKSEPAKAKYILESEAPEINLLTPDYTNNKKPNYTWEIVNEPSQLKLFKLEISRTPNKWFEIKTLESTWNDMLKNYDYINETSCFHPEELGALSDSTYTLRMTAIDTLGNQTIRYKSMVVDTVKPVFKDIYPENNKIYNTSSVDINGYIIEENIDSITITNNTDKNNESIEVSPEEIDFNGYFHKTLSNLSEGSHNFILTALDKAENQQENIIVITNITIDTIAPEISSFTYVGNNEQGQPKFAFDIKEEGSGIAKKTITIYKEGEFLMEKEINNYNEVTITDVQLVDGQSYTAFLTVTDKAGHSASSEEIDLTISTETGDITLTSPLYSKIENYTLSGTVKMDNLTTLTYQIVDIDELPKPLAPVYDANSELYSFEQQITLENEKTTIKITADDDNLGINEKVESFIITLDKTAPVISEVKLNSEVIEQGETYPLEQASASINATVDEENIDKVVLKLDGEEVDSQNNKTAYFSLNNLTNSSHNVEILAYDLAGWESELFSFTLNVNTLVAPTNLNISKANGNNIKLTWIGNGQFNIHRSTNPDQIGSIIATVDTNEYSISNLPQNTIYYYQVTKTDGAVESDPALQTAMLCHQYLAGLQSTQVNYPGNQTTIGVIGQDIANSFDNATNGEIYIDFQHQGQTKQFDLIFNNNQWQEQQSFNANLVINNSDTLKIAVSKNVNWYIIDTKEEE